MSYAYGTDEWEKAYLNMVAKRLAEEPKPYFVGTPEWLDTYEKVVQGDAAYRQAAKAWEGSVVLHILAKPEVGLDNDLFLFMDLWHGDCRSMRLVPKEIGEAADFVITGEYEKWKLVMEEELDPLKGIMQGKFNLQGDLTTILRAAQSAGRLATLVGTLDMKFLDNMNADELDSYKSLFNEMRTEYGI
jgi:putative sterol carrier protein